MAEKIIIGESIAVSELAEKLGVSSADLVGALFKSGVMVTLNDSIDFDTAAIIAEEFDAELEQEKKKDPIAELKSKRKLSNKAQERPPVVAVMGHVDHGKTTLLDSIRDAKVAEGESGGITQHISAYQVEHDGRAITFLDTPGHSAFSALRQHGAALTDVAVIVVAANDGVMPQTKEAIEFAQRAGVSIVVAINKIDADGADPNRVKQQLSDAQLIPEEWGGDTVMVEVSALQKKNIDKLLEMILLVADVDELKAELNVPAEGIVIEAHTSTGQGPIATVLVEHGEIAVGDFVVVGGTYAKIRAMTRPNGKNLEKAGPSTPATLTGFKDVPVFGQRFVQVDNEKSARKQAATAKNDSESTKGVVKSVSGTDLLQAIDEKRSSQVLNIVLKADVQGSLESIIKSLEEVGNEEVKVKVVASGVGDVSESDVSVAEASEAMIVGFHVSASSPVKRQAQQLGVEIAMYKVIYTLLDEARAKLESMLSPEIQEEEIGKLKIKGVFRTTASRVVCGGLVTDGKLTAENSIVKIMRDKEQIAEAQITGLQRGKESAKEVFKDDMCGLELATEEKINLKEDDVLVCVERTSVQKKL